MEIVEFDPTTALPSVGAQRAPEQEQFRAGEVLGAGFRQENDLVNLAQLAMKPVFPIDPNFDLMAALDGNELVGDYASVLGKAQSQAELDFLLGDVQSELRDKQILASSGFGGFIASAAAGVVSPTSLIPMMGPARGIKGAAQSFALAGATITAQEAALYGMQTTRTPEEVMTGIAIGTVLGGLLGTAARELTPSARVDLERGMASKRGVTTILHTDPETGASSRIDFDTIAEVRADPVLPVRDPLNDVTIGKVSPDRNVSVYQAAKQIAPELMEEYEGLKGRTKELRQQINTMQSSRGTDIDTTLVAIDRRIAQLEQSIKTTQGKGPKAKLRAELRETRADKAELQLEPRVAETPELRSLREELMEVDNTRRDIAKDVSKTYAEARAKVGDTDSAADKQAKMNQLLEDYVDEPDVVAPKDTAEPTDAPIKTSDADVRQSSIGAKDARAVGRSLRRKGGVSDKLIDTLAKLNPVTRLLNQTVSTRAQVWMERIQLPGVRLEQIEGIETAAGDGTAFARANVHQTAIADFVRELDDAYARHYSDGKLPEGELQSAFMAVVKSKVGQVPAGKLNYRDFGNAVFDLGNTGGRHPDPYVNQAVASFRKYFAYVDGYADRYFKERQLIDGEDATPLYVKQEFSEEGDIQHYVHHSFDQVEVVDRMDEFIRDFSAHGEGVMKARFTKAHGTFLNAYTKMTDDIALHQHATTDLTAQIKQVNQTIADLNVKHEGSLERAVAYRQRLVDSGMEKQEIAAAMKQFRQGLPDNFADDMRYIRAQQRQLKVLKGAKKMPPARRLQEAEALKLKREELEDTFDTHWRSEGAEDLNVMRGEANFAKQAQDDATNLFRRLSGQQNRIAGIDVLGDRRGPQLQRMLNLPFDVKKKYLITDPEKLVRMHAYTMFPDLELYRITGSANGARIFRDIEDDITTLIQKYDGATHMLGGKPVRKVTLEETEVSVAPDAKSQAKAAVGDLIDVLTGDYVKVRGQTKLTEITEASRAELYRKLRNDADNVSNDMRVVIDRFRHSRGVPKNGDAFGYRIGRAAMNANVMRYMGSVSISSLPDLARPVMKYGLGKVFRHAWAPLVTDTARIKMGRAEAYRFGIALDPLLHNRANAIFDVAENHSLRQTMAERGLEFLSNKTGFVALFDRWTAEMKHMATNATFGEFGAALKNLADGVPDPKSRDMLQAVGINDVMADRIWKQYMKDGGSTEFDGGFRLPNTEEWDDLEAVMAMRAGVSSVVDDLIVTPGLDRPNWMDENQAYRMVAQFRSFTFTATNRIIMSGLQEQDMAFMQGAIMSLGLGAISYYSWAASVGGDTWTKAQNADSEQVIYEAFARSGLLGVLSEGQRIGEQIPGLNDWAVFGGEGRPSRRADSVLGAVLGPSYDLAEKLVTVAQGLSEPTQSTLSTARTAIVPYQNVFFFRQLLDKMEETLGDALDLPERRG